MLDVIETYSLLSFPVIANNFCNSLYDKKIEIASKITYCQAGPLTLKEVGVGERVKEKQREREEEKRKERERVRECEREREQAHRVMHGRCWREEGERKRKGELNL